MTDQTPPNPREMTQAELNDYLDELVRQGKEDEPEFHAAYEVWEKTND